MLADSEDERMADNLILEAVNFDRDYDVENDPMEPNRDQAQELLVLLKTVTGLQDPNPKPQQDQD